MIGLFFIPLLIVCAYSLLSRGPYGGVMRPWTLDSYRRAFDGLYIGILWRSVWLATVSTAICLVLGFPLALFIARAGRRKTLLLNLVMLPFWTSFLIRTYAWMFLLRDTGLVNSALQSIHVIREPLPLLFNTGAVILGLVYGYLPFMVLPLYASLEKLDPVLLDAAGDLGATPWSALWRVIVPLTREGMAAGCLLVIIPCLGAYLTPDLMGGGKTVMVGTLVQNQFTAARDWPFGAAVSLLVMALVLVVMRVVARHTEAML
ncbi:MAG: ABC transporter permease [Bryobacteraceae bacterium]